MWALVHAGSADFEAAVQLRTTQKLLHYLNSLLTNALMKCKVVDDDENACSTPSINNILLLESAQSIIKKTTKTPGRKKA